MWLSKQSFERIPTELSRKEVSLCFLRDFQVTRNGNQTFLEAFLWPREKELYVCQWLKYFAKGTFFTSCVCSQKDSRRHLVDTV